MDRGKLRMSVHECPVIKIKLEPHPDANSLSLVRYENYVLVVKTSQWKDGDLAVHIPEDYVCPDTEQFAFLGTSKRIKPRKFRGIYSDGILIKAPDGLSVGQNAMEALGIKRYDPEIEISFNDDNESGPSGNWPKYDVEGYKKYGDWFNPNELVVATEKIHGASARFLFQDNRTWCGSRTNWKKQSDKDPWWKALHQNPWIESWCRANPGYALYGEIFGRVQNLKYGCEPNQIRFAIFDIRHDRIWINHDEARDMGRGLFWVPEIYRGPLDLNRISELIECDSVVGGKDHVMEGCVIKPLIERESYSGDRIQLKLISRRYFSEK
jgi:RNA ligase (TIGR02306 family)